MQLMNKQYVTQQSGNTPLPPRPSFLVTSLTRVGAAPSTSPDPQFPNVEITNPNENANVDRITSAYTKQCYRKCSFLDKVIRK